MQCVILLSFLSTWIDRIISYQQTIPHFCGNLGHGRNKGGEIKSSSLRTIPLDTLIRRFWIHNSKFKSALLDHLLTQEHIFYKTQRNYWPGSCFGLSCLHYPGYLKWAEIMMSGCKLDLIGHIPAASSNLMQSAGEKFLGMLNVRSIFPMRITGLSATRAFTSTRTPEMSNLSCRATIPVENSIQPASPAPTEFMGENSSSTTKLWRTRYTQRNSPSCPNNLRESIPLSISHLPTSSESIKNHNPWGIQTR